MVLRRILDGLLSSIVAHPSPSGAECEPMLRSVGMPKKRRDLGLLDSSGPAANDVPPQSQEDYQAAANSQEDAPTTASPEETNDESDSIPRNVLTLAGCAALSSCNLGFDIGVNTDAGVLVQTSMDLTDAQLEVFMGSINLFAILGALVSSRVTGAYGLRGSFVVSAVGFVLGILIMVCSQTFGVLMFGRTFVGIGVGFGMTIGPMYISEISPRNQRGRLVSWSEIGTNVGILLGFVSGFFFYPLPPDVGWRAMFGTGVVMPLVMIGLVCGGVMSESPRWLVQRGRYLEATQILRRLYPEGYDVQVVLEEIRDDIEEEMRVQTSGVGWGALLWPSCPAVGRMMLVGVGTAVCAQLSGIDAIQYYLVFVLEEAGIRGRVQQAGFLTALGVLKLTCIFVGAPLFDRLGRRPLMFVSLIGMIAALLIIAFDFIGDASQPWLVVFGLATYLAFFSLGVGPLAWVIPSEIFSTTIRAKAVSLTTFANRVTATLVTSSMLTLANALTWGGYFTFLALLCTLILLFHVTFLPETKGRALEDMVHYFAVVTGSRLKMPRKGSDSDTSSRSSDDIEL